MKILFLSDWHNKKYEIKNNQIDLLITLGDFDWRTIEELDKTYSCKKIGLLGNHDKKDTYRGTGFQRLHKEKIEFEGIKIAGFDGCPRYNTREIGQYEEKEVEGFIKDIGYVDIFIAHANPMLIENENNTDAHRGFKSFTDYIIKEKPKFFVHGHNHNDIKTKLIKTEIISVYPSFLLNI